MIGLRDGLRNGQADAVFAVLSFIKSLEHVGQILLRDAGAIVCHPDDFAFSAAVTAETDLFARVTNRVGNEISEQTLSILLPDRQHNRVFIKIEGKGQPLLLCLRVLLGDTQGQHLPQVDRFLFAGDAQTLRLSEFLDTNTTSFDVLKLPHHGRDEPLLDDLLASTKPTYAVITSSEEEPERDTVVGALEKAGIRVLLTRNQSVTLYSDGNRISIKE